MRFRHWLFAITGLVTVSLLDLQSSAQNSAQNAQEIAGRIIFASGEVGIERSDGLQIRAENRTKLYSGDVLITGSDGNLQIRFADSAVLSLRCNSRLQITSYQYQDSTSDNVSMYLQQGSLRTITGKIQLSNYQLVTDIASIKPGGTDYEVALVSPLKAFFGVYDGTITITTKLGGLELGIANGINFGSADDLKPPIGLALQPPGLGNSGILQPNSACRG